MDSLQRAKQFLARKASKLALVVVPLAALAVTMPAKAGAIVNTSNDPCFTSPSGGSCTLSTVSNGGNGGLNWLQLSGNGTAANLGTYSLDFFSESGGSTNGAFLAAGLVPVSWDFQVVSSGGTVNWSVQYQLILSSGSANFSTSGSSIGTNEVTGNGALTIPSGGGNVNGYFIELELNSTSPFSVNIPSGATLDLNPATVPEPASLLFVAGGGAILLMKRKKRA